jgi:hypothetical protein
MDDDGSVQARARLIRPMGHDVVLAVDFAGSRWREAEAAEFAPLWQAECASVPEFSTSTFHIITGLLLPIWDKLPADNMRVYRFETSDGERVIGRVATPEALSRLYQDLGHGNAPGLSSEDAWTAVLERGGTLDLADGLQIRRSMIMGRNRVELEGFRESTVAQFKALGLTSEIITWRLRLFLPVTTGMTVLAALLERHALLRVNTRRA